MTAATIGIDVGTSGVRVALMDACGALRGIRSSRLAPSDRRNPACWWQAVESALAALNRAATKDDAKLSLFLSAVALLLSLGTFIFLVRK